MKNMKKLLQKAMVFTLTAAMLVGTPMTASAAGLVDLYSISDGTEIIKSDENPTGTVTNTDTNTTTTVLAENEARIIGISLDESDLTVEVGTPADKRQKITATVIMDWGENEPSDEEKAKITEALNSKIKWEVLNLDESKSNPVPSTILAIEASAADRTVVTLNPQKGNKEKMIVRASIDGRYVWTAVRDEDGELAKDEEGNIVFEEDKTELEATKDVLFKADAQVFVKEYTKDLSWKTIPAVYVKHTLDLSQYLVRTPDTANDTITWSSSDTKAATVTAAGVVTFKKTGDVTITAVSEKGVKATQRFNVEAGTPASKVEIYVGNEDGTANVIKKTDDLDLGDSNKISTGVNVRMYAKVDAVLKDDGKTLAQTESEAYQKGDKYVTKKVELLDGTPYVAVNSDKVSVSKTEVKVTDNIAWTSNKTTIATVEGDNDSATITAAGKALGTASITAKASNGKSAKVSTTVKATLTDLQIGNAPKKLYSGQSVQLTADRTPEINKDAIKWSIKKDGNKANPNATINNKGVLTIKPKLDLTTSYGSKVTVVLETTKATNSEGEKFRVEKDITIEQSNIVGFTVYEKENTSNVVAKYETKQTIKGTSNISVPKSKTYIATVDAESTGGAESLTWKSSSEKVAKVEANGDGTAKITAVAKGNATITVSGVKNQKAIKATFKVAVSQPTTSLTMNKTSVVLKDTGKKQTVSFSVKQNKNAKETITWSLVGEKEGVSIDTKKGKVTLDKDAYKAGDVFTVVAKSQSGVTAKATIKVVTASTAVEIRNSDNEDATTFSYYAVKKDGSKGNLVKNATVLNLGGEPLTLYPMVNVGDKNEAKWILAGSSFTNADGTTKVAADVTYTVNKKGIVQIIGNEVYRVNNGTVTITVKTADGKSYKLKIDDASKAWSEESSAE